MGTHYDTLSPDAVSRLSLRVLSLVPLDSGAPPPTDVRFVAAMRDGKLAIGDQSTESIRIYRRDGTLTFMRRWQDIARVLARPIALRADGDTLLVLDVLGTHGVVGMSDTGAVVLSVAPRGLTSLSSVVRIGKSIVFATIPSTSDLLRRDATVLTWTDASGTPQMHRCAPDPVYRLSAAQHGMFSLYSIFGVQAQAGEIYCWQPASPVVQVFDSIGGARRQISVTPPFYRRSADVPGSNDPVTNNQFRSGFTEHVFFWPNDSGFVSVYGTFELTREQSMYHVFACDRQATPTHCATGATAAQPVAFIPPDTLVSIMPASNGRAGVTLGLLLVR